MADKELLECAKICKTLDEKMEEIKGAVTDKEVSA